MAKHILAENQAALSTNPPVKLKTIERQGASRVPFTERHPRVIGGVCESCGILNRDVSSEYQYQLCRHYSGMQLRCSYCDESKDPNEVVKGHKLNIASHPDNPDKLVVWCGQFKCDTAHRKRFSPTRE